MRLQIWNTKVQTQIQTPPLLLLLLSCLPNSIWYFQSLKSLLWHQSEKLWCHKRSSETTFSICRRLYLLFRKVLRLKSEVMSARRSVKPLSTLKTSEITFVQMAGWKWKDLKWNYICYICRKGLGVSYTKTFGKGQDGMWCEVSFKINHIALSSQKFRSR